MFFFQILTIIISFHVYSGQTQGRPKGQPEISTGYGYTTKNCMQDQFGGHTIPFDIYGNFIEECAPDTLYVWKDSRTILSMGNSSSGYNVLGIPLGLYTWRTPIGTYGYDDNLVRIKLKGHTQFKLIDRKDRDCSKYSEYERETYVFVSHVGPTPNVADYILCGSGTVASWSYGLEENLEEVLWEKSWIDSMKSKNSVMPKNPNYDAYSKVPPRGRRLNYQNNTRCYFGFKIDQSKGQRINWESERLSQNIRKLQDVVSRNAGRIFFANGYSSRHDHFRTKTPSYFNPRN